MDFSLLTYNIHKGIGNDRLYNLDRIVNIIKDNDPDFVALQEVDHSVPRSRYDNQAEILAEKLGYHYVLGLNVKLKKGSYGNATLSKHPIQDHTNINLTWSIKKPRSCLASIIQTGHGSVAIMNYHLGLAGIERARQVKMIFESDFMKEYTDLPTVILGDSNDRAHRLNPIFSRHGYDDTCHNARIYTFPSFAPVWRLDKIYYNHFLQLKEHHVMQNSLTRIASDHLPVFARFRIKKT